MNFGIKIESGEVPYNLTTVVSIVPRFIITNKLPFPINVTQYKSQEQNILIQPNQNICYNFRKVLNITDKKLCVREAKEGVSYSNPFFIEDLDDFQVPFKVPKEFSQEKGEWFEPTEQNGSHKSVRVSISSEDHATLFIAFSLPSKRKC